MSTDSVYFQKSICSFKKHRSFVWIYSQLQIHTMFYVIQEGIEKELIKKKKQKA